MTPHAYVSNFWKEQVCVCLNILPSFFYEIVWDLSSLFRQKHEKWHKSKWSARTI